MIASETLLGGLKKGLKITWVLTRVIVPVYFFVTILKYTPVLPWISELMVPVMKFVGLPGEASLALVLGYTVNIYAAIGAILPLHMNVKEITIISAMLLMAHSLPVETAVNKQTGVSVYSLVLIRIVLSFAFGITFNWLL